MIVNSKETKINLCKLNNKLEKIASKSLNEEDGIALAKALENNKTLQELFIGIFRIKCGIKQMIWLFHLFWFNKRAMKPTNIDKNKIGDNGAIALGKTLENNKTLQRLAISIFRIKCGIKQMIWLFHLFLFNKRSMKPKNIAYNNIGDNGGIALGKALENNKTLQTLAISIFRIKCGIKQMIWLFHLFWFNKRAMKPKNIAYNNIGDNGAIALGKALENNKTLQRLAISIFRIKCGIKQMIWLLHLFLFNKRAMKPKNIAYNNIGDNGAIALGKALENNKTLQTLAISIFRIKQMIWFFHLFWFNKRAMKPTNIDENKIGDKGGIALGKALENNKTLQRLAISIFRIKCGIKQMIWLFHLFWFDKRILKPTNIVKNNIGDNGAIALGKALENNKTLQRLYIGIFRIKCGIKQMIWLFHLFWFNKRAMKPTNIDENKIGDKGGIALGKALENNKTLQELSIGIFRIKCGIKQMIWLFHLFWFNKRTMKPTNIDYNNISENGGIALGKALENNKTLQTLYISIFRIKQMIWLFHLFWFNKRILKPTNIVKNNIGDNGAIALGKALKNNKTLQELSIGIFRIKSEIKQMIWLFHLFWFNKRAMKPTNIGENKISDNGAIALGKALENNKTLQTLYISIFRIKCGIKQMIWLFHLFLFNKRAMKPKNIVKNNISDNGAIALGKALENNKTLQKLYIGIFRIKCGIKQMIWLFHLFLFKKEQWNQKI